MERDLTEEEWAKYYQLKVRVIFNYLLYNSLSKEDKTLLEIGDDKKFSEYLAECDKK